MWRKSIETKIHLWFLTSAGQSPDVKPRGRWKEIDIAEVRSCHWPSFKDRALESHSLYVYFGPALIISCDKLHGRSEKRNLKLRNSQYIPLCLYQTWNNEDRTPQVDFILLPDDSIPWKGKNEVSLKETVCEPYADMIIMINANFD